MYLIHTYPKRDTVVIVISHMIYQMLTMKLMIRIGEMILIVIWSEFKMGVMMWYITADTDAQKVSKKFRS